MHFVNRLFAIVFILFYSSLSAQEDFGGRIGVSMQFGTHSQRFGVMYQIFYYQNHLQLSNGLYAFFTAKNLGPKTSYAELQVQFGIQGQWHSSDGKKYLLNESSNMSPFLNSLGYSFYFYLASNETSQSTGMIHGTFDKFHFGLQNDALGLNQIDDKFRTGALLFGYQTDSLLLSIQSTLWTGKSADGERVSSNTYPSKFGYRDISRAKYGNISHGILALRADYLWVYDQVLRGEVGMDSERIRHILQNKMIHDAFSTRIIPSENPHYPMIQENGEMYLFREGEKPKRNKAFLQFGLNQPVFY